MDTFLRRAILVILCCIIWIGKTWAQTINKFEEGHFTDTKGYVYNGQICLRPSAYEFKNSKNPRILFKSGENGQKQSILLQDIVSMVVKQDSFVTARMPNSVEYTWFRVLIDGPVKVYQTEIPGSGGGGIRPSIGLGGGGMGVGMGGGVGISLGGGGRGSMIYVYGEDASRVNSLNRKNFVEVLEKAVADNPELKGKIADKTYRYADIEKLSKAYNHISQE